MTKTPGLQSTILAMPHDAYSALRVPPFRRYLIATSLVSMGTAAQGLAIGWEMYDRTNQALALGLVGLVQAIPICSAPCPPVIWPTFSTAANS